MLHGLNVIHFWWRGGKPRTHWNLNSFPVHDFSKLSLIEAYNTHQIFDMMFFSETYLDSSYPDDDTRLNFKEFILIRADNPHNSKRGGLVFILKNIWLFAPEVH